MIGNVWEWTRDRYASWAERNDPDAGAGVGVMKGGSHLCAPSYCVRFRAAARHPQEPDVGGVAHRVPHGAPCGRAWHGRVAKMKQARSLSSDGEDGERSDSRDFTAAVAANLRRLRTRRGLSLERLGQRSGVSRAMLGQIELGQSTPTINVVWKIARALGVPFSALLASNAGSAPLVMRQAQAKLLTSKDGRFTSRALFPVDQPRRVEFYELRLAAGSQELADAHPPGTIENLVVASGSVEIGVGGSTHQLATGDAILFQADGPHRYGNRASVDAVMYLVMTYGEDLG